MVFRRRDRIANQSPRQTGQGSMERRGDILIGHDIDKGEEVWFSLKDWLGHWHVAGPPGVGKTSLLEIIIRALLRLKEGFCLIDPLGPVYERVVDFLSWHPELAENVVIISPGDTDPWWPGFNPMKRVPYIQDPSVHTDLIADAVCKVFGDDRTATPLLSRKTEEAAEPLVMGGYTFLEMTYFTRLSQGHVRQELVRHSRADGVAEEWAEFEALSRNQKRDELGSLRNRLPRFTRNRAVRLLLGRNENTLDLAEVVEGGKQLLVNLAPKQGLLGPSHSYLLGCLLVAFLTSYMRSRTQEQADARKYYLIIDEFQNMLTADIAAALDELRNFGLRMVMSHQRFGQLTRENPDLLDAVLIDSRIKAVFGSLSPDALTLIEPFIFMGEHDLEAIKHRGFSGQEMVPEFYTLQELRYQKQAQLYRQPRQHMTLKLLTEPACRVRVSDVESYPRDEDRRQALMSLVVNNHPQYYLHEDEIQHIIAVRQRGLENPEGPAGEPTSFLEPKR